MDNGLGEVKPCECGGVYLSMGPMTLHFAPDEYIALVELVEAGVDMINPEPNEDAFEMCGNDTIN